MTGPHDLIDIPFTLALLRGAVELEQTAHGLRPHRLPAWARAQWLDPQLLMAEAQPAGVRIAVRTRASAVELDMRPTKRRYAGMPARPDGLYDLRIDGRAAGQGSIAHGNVLHIDMAAGSATLEAGPFGTLRFADLGSATKDVEIWLPHDEATELVALRADAPVEPLPAAGPVWLHHGSSISQGSNALSPTGTWPAVAASRAGLDLVNLGFGGSALLDPFVARTMRDMPADLISVKLGINLVNTDLMRLRAFGPAVHGMLDTIRDGHPRTPLLIISPIFCPIHEDVPGPTVPELAEDGLRFAAAGDSAGVRAGKLTLNIVRAALAAIVAQRAATDPNLHYLDGRSLYREPDHALLPLPDRLHPDAAAHLLMGRRFADSAFVSRHAGRHVQQSASAGR